MVSRPPVFDPKTKRVRKNAIAEKKTPYCEKVYSILTCLGSNTRLYGSISVSRVPKKIMGLHRIFFCPIKNRESQKRIHFQNSRVIRKKTIASSQKYVFFQSVAVLGMRNGTSQSPFRPALGRQLVRAADAPLRGHGFGTSRLRQTPTTNGLTAYRMRLHLACVSSGTYGPFATSASRSRLRLPRTTRLALPWRAAWDLSSLSRLTVGSHSGTE